ncbi:protein disulfide-isomerase A6 homolog [Paramacrobiotus metropolitanus]|uniref:protein disulfide-isomerase A6 homolog n=1 Tax=Paramacrobiotus metropolitanus TaxID=2943436 RepID=UPI002445B5D2|nr:protein disulfide-isomerase A6 homolog [Paramacrobiotus metropolitanus]
MMFRAVLGVLVSIACVQALYDGDSNVIELTTTNFQKEVVKSNDLWIVEFFAPWCGHCKSLAPEYAKAAKALKGFIKVGAVNVDDQRSLGQEYNVQGFPTIKIFGTDKKKPEEYSGPRTAEGLIDGAFKAARAAALGRIGKKASSGGGGGSSGGANNKGNSEPGGGKDVVKLDDSNFEELVLNSDEPWMVEFYAPWCGHCKSLAPEWAKAASELKGKMKLGAYDADAQKTYAGRYQIRGFPTIKYFAAGKKDDPQDYDGPRDASGIVAWASDKSADSAPAPELSEIVGPEVVKASCEGQPLCIISVLPHILDCQSKCRKQHLEMLTKMGEKYKRQRWGWLWAEAGSQPKLEEAIGLGGFGYPAMAAVSVKKGKFAHLRLSFSQDGINEFLRELAAGRGSTEPIRGGALPKVEKIEAWDGKDGKLPVEEDINLDDIELDPIAKEEL